MNKNINNFLKYGIMTIVYAMLFVPFIVSGSLYFPYITGKAHAFRLLVELGFAMYIILVIRDRSYLPAKNPLMWAVLAFTVILGIATLHAEDPYKSFWSNFERMEGYVTIIHLFAFYLMTTATFRSRQAWLGILNTALGVSLLMGIRGFMDYSNPHDPSAALRIAGSLGNSTYLGVYALIHIFIAGLLIFNTLKTHKATQALGRIITYAVVLLFNIIVMYNTGTRGSFLGLLAGILVIALILAVFERQQKMLRKVSIGFLLAVVLAVGTLGAIKNTDFVKNSTLLNRFASLIRFDVSSILNTEGHARTLLWSMASKGVAERPLLGWGQDNFGYVFAKYYDPKMYDQEQWFDRTHDVFFDWLIAGGILGLLSYLALFAAALYIVWRGSKSALVASEWNLAEKATITGLFVAYFVHNIFVFDNLTSYILCFILFAYIASRYNNAQVPTKESHQPLLANEYGQLAIALVVIAGLVYTINYVVYKPYLAGSELILSLEPQVADSNAPSGARVQTSAERLTHLQNLVDLNTFGTGEAREQIADIAASIIPKETDKNVVKQYVDFVDTQYQDQFARTPHDPRPFIFYGIYLQRLGLYEQALTYINKAVSLSPTKQSFLYQLGSTLINNGKIAEGTAVFKNAYELDTDNPEARILYAVGLIYNKQANEALTIIGTSTQVMTDKRILSSLVQMKQYDIVVTLIKKQIEKNPTEPQAHVSLAAAYLRLGRRQDAIAEIQKAMELSSAFKTQGEYYIREIEAGRDPSQEAPAGK